MIIKQLKTWIYLIAALCGIFMSGSLFANELIGAGATFPYPLYAKMFSEYHKETEIKVNYQAIGSGGGVRQLKNKTVDFGASDAFLSEKEIQLIKAPVVHIPICMGAIVLSYNLEGVPTLNLTPEVITDIYMGKIRAWNDPKISAINPDIKLPKMPIAVVKRSDGSGSTFIFTDYLSKVSDTWKKSVGVGKSVRWPIGLGGKGNAGVAGLIKSTPGSIGYIEMVYALQNDMSLANVKNKQNHYIHPSVTATTEAGDIKIPDDTRVSLTNTDAANGYPISGFTWILLYQDQDFNDRSLEQAKLTVDLVRWMITEGQSYAADMGYAPLPQSAVKKAEKLLNSVTYKGTLLNTQ